MTSSNVSNHSINSYKLLEDLVHKDKHEINKEATNLTEQKKLASVTVKTKNGATVELNAYKFAQTIRQYVDNFTELNDVQLKTILFTKDKDGAITGIESVRSNHSVFRDLIKKKKIPLNLIVSTCIANSKTFVQKRENEKIQEGFVKSNLARLVGDGTDKITQFTSPREGLYSVKLGENEASRYTKNERVEIFSDAKKKYDQCCLSA